MQTKKEETTHTNLITTFVKNNYKGILGVIIAVVLITAGYCAYGAYQNKKSQKVWGDMFLAELTFLTDKDNSTAALEQYAKANKDNEAGAYASLMLGNIYYQSSDFPKAELNFKQALASKFKDIAAMAEVSLISTLMAQDLNDLAIAQADAFIAKNANHFALAQVAHSKALAQELSGKQEEAKAAYNKIAQDYPATYYAAFAELRLKALN